MICLLLIRFRVLKLELCSIFSTSWFNFFIQCVCIISLCIIFVAAFVQTERQNYSHNVNAMFKCIKLIVLADRTLYKVELMRQACVRRSSVTLCIVAKRCVLEQTLLLTACRKSYEKLIGTKLNDLDLYLEVISRSRQPLRYIWRWISRKPLKIEAWFQRTTNRKWHMGYQMVTWPMTSRDPERSNSWSHESNKANSKRSKLYAPPEFKAAVRGDLVEM